MSIEIKELVGLAQASEKYKISENDILFKSLDSELSLYYLSTKNVREALIPCQDVITKGLCRSNYRATLS